MGHGVDSEPSGWVTDYALMASLCKDPAIAGTDACKAPPPAYGGPERTCMDYGKLHGHSSGYVECGGGCGSGQTCTTFGNQKCCVPDANTTDTDCNPMKGGWCGTPAKVAQCTQCGGSCTLNTPCIIPTQ